ncbi:MAG: dTMP kinase [Deltaproteobacteria bacterium]|nr:dTMP kinase [Deltaproteobacteria bacterium]MBI3386707.1 dTMP kinase [Deltaproteobacteria bacterium]
MHGEDKAFYGHGLPYLKIGSLRGSLIVIEGTDGVGRSTQIEQLTPWLEVQGHGVTNTGWTRSPLLSETINEAKAGHELTVTTFSLLYAADFADRLENEIIPALRAGFIVVADRYMYTAFARNAVMRADPKWTRELFGCALVPDLVLYLKIDADHLIPRVLEGKGMDYWESGMHLALGSDIFDSFRHYQTRLIREYNRLAQEFQFVTIDARRPIETIQADLRRHISSYLNRSKRPPADPASLAESKLAVDE